MAATAVTIEIGAMILAGISILTLILNIYIYHKTKKDGEKKIEAMKKIEESINKQVGAIEKGIEIQKQEQREKLIKTGVECYEKQGHLDGFFRSSIKDLPPEEGEEIFMAIFGRVTEPPARTPEDGKEHFWNIWNKYNKTCS